MDVRDFDLGSSVREVEERGKLGIAPISSRNCVTMQTNTRNMNLDIAKLT
jgi:hypothetical protein